jgi:hypothetical protein
MDGLAWLKANNHLYAGIKIPVFPSEESTPPVIEINCDSRKLRHDENIRNDGWLPETSVTEKDQFYLRLILGSILRIRMPYLYMIFREIGIVQSIYVF